MTAAVDAVVAAIAAGRAAILPTDTVYGLVADAFREGPVHALYTLKQRPLTTPCALLAAEIDAILDAVPELRGPAAAAARALLPGPYTLILPNPAGRLPWLCGATPQAIGLRVPRLAPEAQAVLERVGAVASTSANVHGGPDPRRVDDIPEELRAEVGAILDGGELPGTPSTVLDLTGPRPAVLRQGAGSVAHALERLTADL
jgi:L-threonylcarbamoyladenylate synthase